MTLHDSSAPTAGKQILTHRIAMLSSYYVAALRERSRDLKHVGVRLAAGLMVGAIISLGLHLFTSDYRFPAAISRGWDILLARAPHDQTHDFRPELALFCLGAIGIGLPWSVQSLTRYARSWWAGISSAVLYFAVATSAALAFYGNKLPWVWVLLGVSQLLCLALLELWRRNAGLSPKAPSPLKLNIPSFQSEDSHVPNWTAGISDNPIRRWKDDVVGRAGVVELIADYLLCQRVPVLALHGGLGDGKTSVLNLLRSAIEQQAIAVSFTAWLPASETSFASELFNDIATESRKVVKVMHVRKRGLMFARMITDSLPHLTTLKQLVPTQSQREEIEELFEIFSRIPRPIVVLLDEIDRMERDELVVLLKILRGASSIPNVSFVCAFSKDHVMERMRVSDDYMEKFFPIAINLSPPSADVVRRLFVSALRERIKDHSWFWNDKEANAFFELLNERWADCLQPVCTNLRKAGILINCVIVAGHSLEGDINLFDLLSIETLRLFYPNVYNTVRRGEAFLTGQHGDPYAPDRDRTEQFFATLYESIKECREPGAVRYIVSLMFPDCSYRFGDQMTAIVAYNSRKEERGRICDSEYFSIYFRSTIPEDMFSDARLADIVSELNKSNSVGETASIYNSIISELPRASPKRIDFMRKLSREFERLSDISAEYLAYAVAALSCDYQYDLWSGNELSRGINIVLHAAQKLSSTSRGQTLLENCVTQATNSTFAEKILFFMENRDRKEIVSNFSNINVPALVDVFIKRMRRECQVQASFSWERYDWSSIRRWTAYSEADRETFGRLARARVGGSRKQLAQLINFFYPAGWVWENPPSQSWTRYSQLLRSNTCSKVCRTSRSMMMSGTQSTDSSN